MPTVGVKPLRRIQGFKEVTPGTGGTSTWLWRGTGTLEDITEVKEVEEDIGFLIGLDRTYIAKTGGKLSFDSVPATYQQLPYIFEAGIKAVHTGAADGSGSDKIYTYPVSTNSANTLNTYSLEGGDNVGAEVMHYSFVEGFKMSGKSGEAVMISADWQGQAVSTTTFSTQPATPTVNEILFQQAKLYIDAINGTAGTTQITNSFMAFDLDCKTAVTPVFSGDGNLFFSFTKITMPEVTIKVTFEHETQSISEKTNWRNQTARKMQIKVTGPAVTTAGTAYSNLTLKMDFPGKWMKFDKIGELNGNDIVIGTFKSKYDSTAGSGPVFTVVNELTTLV